MLFVMLLVVGVLFGIGIGVAITENSAVEQPKADEEVVKEVVVTATVVPTATLTEIPTPTSTSIPTEPVVTAAPTMAAIPITRPIKEGGDLPLPRPANLSTPAVEVAHTSTPVLNPRVSAGGSCSTADLNEVPEVLWFYAQAVACIEADDRQGTGFVVRSTEAGEGYLLTNAHVVGVDPTAVVVHLENVVYSATVVLVSIERDLAMVRICCGDFTVLKRANRGVRFGEWVGSVGFHGGNFTYSGGIARATYERGLNTYLEHTADVHPGGSGGPLLVFPLEAVQRAEAGEGWSLEEGEDLAVIGVTAARSLEYDYTTYTIHQWDVSQFVGQAIGYTSRSQAVEYTVDW